MIKNIILGVITGIICGLFASGGGLILVPVYVYLLKIDEAKARATSILSILPMAFVSSYIYNKENCIDWKIGVLYAIGGIIGGLLGAKILNKINVRMLKIIFTVFLIYASAKMLMF